MGLFSVGLTTALALFCSLLSSGDVLAESDVLHGGWDSESPYRYEKTLPSGSTALTGLDIEIMRALCKKAGFRVIFEEIPWTENLREVREGRLDFGLAVTPEEGPPPMGVVYGSLPKGDYRRFQTKGRGSELGLGGAFGKPSALP